MRLAGTALLLFALWLLMSGIYKPMIVGFGVISVAIVVLVVRRMDGVDDDKVELRLRPVAFVRYILWLLVEIGKSNWAVTRIILSPTMATRQHLFRVPYTQKSDLGQVIFANSITLTPGTISVEVEPGHILVHAVNFSAGDLDVLAEMDAGVRETEGKAAI